MSKYEYFSIATKTKDVSTIYNLWTARDQSLQYPLNGSMSHCFVYKIKLGLHAVMLLLFSNDKSKISPDFV